VHTAGYIFSPIHATGDAKTFDVRMAADRLTGRKAPPNEALPTIKLQRVKSKSGYKTANEPGKEIQQHPSKVHPNKA